MLFFILTPQDLKNLIPDYELSVCKSRFGSILSSDPKCHEAYFGLSRLLSFENRFIESLSYLNSAIFLYPDPLYLTLYAILSVKSNKPAKITAKPSQFSCCSTPSQCSPELVTSRLELLPKTPETLWCYMELSRSGIETEAAEFYATSIKEIDPYLGYLAWSEIYMEKEWAKGVDVLKELIIQYPYRPEAYAKLWSYYYYTARDYEAAEDISSEAFLRVTSPEHNAYFISFCIACAKSYFKTGKTVNALRLLQKKFLENSEYTVFLYQFGRLCCKSEDSLYLGSGIGALKECLKLCEASRLPKVHFWLSKAHLQSRHYFEAYKHINKALSSPDLAHNHREQLKMWAIDLDPFISHIKQIETFLEQGFSSNTLDQALELLRRIGKFHRLSANLIEVKIMWKIGKQREAIEKLQHLCQLGGFRGNRFRLLFSLLERSSEFAVMEKCALDMIAKCRNTHVPTEFWVNANIWYAKSLVKNGKPKKAILVLKIISKVFTPFPYINIGYTRALQRAANVQQLIDPQAMNFHTYDLYKSSFTTIREFSQRLLEENDAPMPDLGGFKGRRAERTATEGIMKYKQFFVYLNENQESECEVPNQIELNVNSNEEDFIGISVYSNPKFLFLIAKYAYKFNVCVQDGICAIKDFLEVLEFRNKGKKYGVMVKKAEKMLKFLSENINNSASI
jgi:tetratricopeptide (TPR) repeat protein